MNPDLQNTINDIGGRRLALAVAEIARKFAPLCVRFIDWIISQKPRGRVRFVLRDAEIFSETAKTLSKASPKYKVCADWTADYLTHNMIDRISTERLQRCLSKNWDASMTIVDTGCEGSMLRALRKCFPHNEYDALFLGSDNPEIPGFLNECSEAAYFIDAFRQQIKDKRLVSYKEGGASFAVLLEQYPKKEFSPHTLYHRTDGGELYIINDFGKYTLCPDESKPYLYLQNAGLKSIDDADGELHIRMHNNFVLALHHIFFNSLRAEVLKCEGGGILPSIKETVREIYDISPELMEMRDYKIGNHDGGFANFEEVNRRNISRILKVR
ncbi:MAG: hypothetical protein FWG18_02920 [Alphaproteobacteria bacterium]|nr:hypothetical protein [Alphaproteobacteria bacterium]